MPLALDPFKQRLESPGPTRKDLLLTKREIDLIIQHAQRTSDEDHENVHQTHVQRAEEATGTQLQTSKEITRTQLQMDKEATKKLREAMVPKQKAADERRKRQYAKEIECVHQDLEREKKTQIRKKQVLDQAYKRLYEETDRVKYFKAAKNLAELLKEREGQKESKAFMKDSMAQYDAQLLIGMLKDMERHREEESDKKAWQEKNKKINADNWTKQHAEALQKKERERWDHVKDGFHIRDEAEQEKLKEVKKLENKKQRDRNYSKMLDRQIMERQALSDLHEDLESADDAKAKLFLDAKEQMLLEHKKIKEDLDRQKAGRRDLVSKNLNTTSATQKAKEAANLEKAVRQAEDKAFEESALRQAEQNDAKDAIRRFHDKKMADKQRQKVEDRLKSYQDQRATLEEIERLKNIEDSKARRRHDLETDAQHMQLHQIAEHRTEEKAKEIEELKDYMRHMRGLDDEEETFQEYAQHEIKEAEKRGINTHAMKMAARPGIECGKGPLFKDRGHIRPRYYAASWNPQDLGHIAKDEKNMPDTKSRLGFGF